MTIGWNESKEIRVRNAMGDFPVEIMRKRKARLESVVGVRWSPQKEVSVYRHMNVLELKCSFARVILTGQ
jgi:hypothetical protein